MIAASARLRRSAATSVVFVAALRGGVMAQTQQASPLPRPDASRFAPDALEKYAVEWRAAARAHVGGRFDEPAAAIAGWPFERTRAVIARAIRLLERDAQRAGRTVADDSTLVVAKGVILHTDIAIAERTGEARTSTGGVDVVMMDGEPVGARLFSTHWGHARRLADALGRAPDAAAIRDTGGAPTRHVARTWYRATAAFFQEWEDFGHLHDHLAHVDEQIGEDPVLLLYRGTLHQAFADPRVQSYRIQRRRALVGRPDGVRPRIPIESAGTELDLAERALRRAAAIDPSLVEARIRLAHVLSVRGRPVEGAPLAQRALESPLPGFLDYYAAMVLGRIELQLGRYQEARAAFERAAARYPHSQTTKVALSQMSLMDGLASDGVTAVVRALGPGTAEEIEEDPWWRYFRLHEPNAQALLEALRTSVP